MRYLFAAFIGLLTLGALSTVNAAPPRALEKFATESTLGDCTPRRIIAVHGHRAVAVEVVRAIDYGHSYPKFSYGGPDLSDVLKLLIEQNQKLMEKHEALLLRLSAGGPAVLPLKAESVGRTLMLNRCAKCHEAAVATAKGGKYVFFKGGEFLDEGTNLKDCHEAIKKGRMPRDGKLTGEEKYEILSFLVELPAPEGKK